MPGWKVLDEGDCSGELRARCKELDEVEGCVCDSGQCLDIEEGRETRKELIIKF